MLVLLGTLAVGVMLSLAIDHDKPKYEVFSPENVAYAESVIAQKGQDLCSDLKAINEANSNLETRPLPEFCR